MVSCYLSGIYIYFRNPQPQEDQILPQQQLLTIITVDTMVILGLRTHSQVSRILASYNLNSSRVGPDIRLDTRHYNLLYYTTKIPVNKQSQALFFKMIWVLPIQECAGYQISGIRNQLDIRYPTKYVSGLTLGPTDMTALTTIQLVAMLLMKMIKW